MDDDRGSCWHCRYLSIYREVGERYWHYKCRKDMSKELDPLTFIYCKDCFDRRPDNHYRFTKKEAEFRTDDPVEDVLGTLFDYL